MKPKVYIETTVVSYLTSRPSRDIVIAGYQQVTREWWQDAANRFELVASELVINETSAGDADAARDRLTAASIRNTAGRDRGSRGAGTRTDRCRCDSQEGSRRCGSHCDRCYKWHRLSGNMELSTYRECNHAVSDRTDLPQFGLRANHYLYACRTHGT